MTDRLDAALVDLAGAIDFPPTPDLRAGRRRSACAARSAEAGFAPLPRALVWRSSRLLVLATAAAALVLLVPGLRLTLVPSLPTASVPADPLATRLALGSRCAGRRGRLAGARSARARPTRLRQSATTRSSRWSTARRDDLPELDGTGSVCWSRQIDGALDASRSRSSSSRSAPASPPVEVDGARRLLDRRAAAPAPLPRPGWRGERRDDAAGRRHARLGAGRHALPDRVRPRPRRDPAHRGVDRRRRREPPGRGGVSVQGKEPSRSMPIHATSHPHDALAGGAGRARGADGGAP